MRRAAGLDEFRAGPVGQFLAGRSWIHFCAHRELFGIAFFGRPDRGDVAALTASLLVELGDGIAPHRSLVDARRLTGVDAGAFEALHRYVREQHARLSVQVTRLALVRPGGMQGAVVAGFYGVLDPPYPTSVFDEPAPALAWLGEPAPQLADELAAAVDEVSGVHPIVGALRALLAGNPSLSAPAACRALGLSERTLQRRLEAAGTSFQKELVATRIAEAQRRLLDSDDPLTAVALDVGFSSLQHFSHQFRLTTGEAPSAWRARRRGGG